LAVILVVVSVMSFGEQEEYTAPSRWIERLPQGSKFDLSLFQRPFAVSPDGNWIAFVAQDSSGNQLYLRNLNEHEAVAIPNTSGAGNPFFSPDGDWVGFYADGKIQKVSTGGGEPLVVCEMSLLSSGTHWGTNDTILFARIPDGIFRVPATGGIPEQLTSPNAAAGEQLHSWPQILPDGKTVLFMVNTTPALLNLETLAWSTIDGVGEANSARYLRSGHLLLVQGGLLRSIRFDVERLEVLGTPSVVPDSTAVPGFGVNMQYDVSDAGLLLSIREDVAEKRLVWVDRSGVVTPLPTESAPFLRPQLSPDGSMVAVARPTEHGYGWEAWVYNAREGTGRPLQVGVTAYEPIWSFDGEHVAFGFGPNANRIGWMRNDGVGGLDTLWSGDEPRFHHSWSPEGILAGYGVSERDDRDIWHLDLTGGGEMEWLVSTVANERSPAFSPDGRWLAYVSDEAGRDEIYVQPYPGMDRKFQVSRRGGRDPVWSHDGRELFFRNGDIMMAATIVSSPSFSATPRELFRGQFDTEPGLSGSHSYDVSPDGQRFLMIQSDPVAEIRVVLNWSPESDEER